MMMMMMTMTTMMTIKISRVPDIVYDRTASQYTRITTTTTTTMMMTMMMMMMIKMSRTPGIV